MTDMLPDGRLIPDEDTLQNHVRLVLQQRLVFEEIAALAGRLRIALKVSDDDLRRLAGLAEMAATETRRVADNVRRVNTNMHREVDVGTMVSDEESWEIYDQDRAEMRAALKTGDRHIFSVSGQSVSIALGARGCCLLKLYRQMRDAKAPQEDELFVCNERCGVLAEQWRMTKGMLRPIS